MINSNKKLLYFLPLLFGVLFLFVISNYLWVNITQDSDPAQYLMIVLGRNGEYWLWLDRIFFANMIKIFSFLPIDDVYISPYYMITINTMSVVIITHYCYKNFGIIGFIISASLLIGSFYNLIYSTFLYPESTGIFFSLLTFCCVSNNKQGWRIILAGVFCSFACFSKITFIPLLLVISVYFFIKERRVLFVFLKGFLFGLVVVLLLYVILFGYDNLVYPIVHFDENLARNIINKDRPNNLVPWLLLLFSVVSFPIYTSLFIIKDLYNEKNIFTTMLSVSFILFILLIYTAGERGGEVLPHYISQATPFLIISLTSFLSSKYHSKLKKPELYICGLFILCVFALFFYKRIHPFYFLIPPLSLYALHRIRTRNKILDLVLLLAISVGLALPMNLQKSIRFWSRTNKISNKLLAEARILEQVGEGDYYIYIEKWNKGYGRQIIDYYNSFFIEKRPPLNKDLYIPDRKIFLSLNKGQPYYVLTDQVVSGDCIKINTFTDEETLLSYYRCN